MFHLLDNQLTEDMNEFFLVIINLLLSVRISQFRDMHRLVYDVDFDFNQIHFDFNQLQHPVKLLFTCMLLIVE